MFGKRKRVMESDTLMHRSPILLCSAALTGSFVGRDQERADWSAGPECHRASSGLEFVCVRACVCVRWVNGYPLSGWLCSEPCTLALFVPRTLHTLHKHTHTHTCIRTDIWIGTRHFSSALAKRKERERGTYKQNSTIHSHGSVVLPGPGSALEWLWS